MINQNLKILHTASFFLAELTASKINALLIILQSLLAPYQLLLYKKSTFTILLWLASHFTDRANNAHISPYFYFAFSVLWSSPVEQFIKSEVLLTPLTMAVTIYFKVLWQDFVQFLCQTKMNSID